MAGRGVSALLFLLSMSTLGWAAGRPTTSRAVGYLATRGEVRVGGHAALSGTTVFAGDVISTGRGSSVEVRLQSGTIATLSENGELSLDTDSAALRLSQGVVTVRNAGDQQARLLLPNATVVMQSEGGFPALCRVAASGRVAQIFADRGRVEVRGRGQARLLLPGKSLRLEAGMPQAAGQPAGKVANAIPDETLQHSGQAAQAPLKVHDGVLWEDTVRTLGNGRVRIALEDGSLINIGARSVMRITKHDAQSQQTEIELQLGKLRGQVVKLSKPGASFQVKTNTAVIGVVGTILIIDALPNLTHVRCLEGMVNVKNLNPAIAGETTLHAGEQTHVGAGQAPAPAAPSPPAEISSDLNLTNAGETPSPQFAKFGEMGHLQRPIPPTGAAGQAAGTGVSGGITGINAVGTVAAGVSTGLAGAGVVKAGSAKDAANAAANTAGQAQDAANAANDAATSASNTATAFGTGVSTFIQSISPGGPGCACLP